MSDNNVPTQKQMVLEHLQRFGFIEPLTALREYGCYRLGAVIKKLRDDGVRVKTVRMGGFSRITGRKLNYAKYVLVA